MLRLMKLKIPKSLDGRLALAQRLAAKLGLTLHAINFRVDALDFPCVSCTWHDPRRSGPKPTVDRVIDRVAARVTKSRGRAHLEPLEDELGVRHGRINLVAALSMTFQLMDEWVKRGLITHSYHSDLSTSLKSECLRMAVLPGSHPHDPA